VGVQVRGDRIQHRGTVENRRIDKTILGFDSRPAVTSLVSVFCGLDGPSFEKPMRCATKDVLPLPRPVAKGPADGGSEAGLLVTEHRSRPSTP
jgi:hypothetical protein